MRNVLKLFTLSLLTCLLFSCKEAVHVEAIYVTVPQVQNLELKDGVSFVLTNGTKIVYAEENEQLKQTANFLSEYINQNTGLKLAVTNVMSDEDAIILKKGNESSNAEAYELIVGENQIVINGASESGVFYGVQTLRKSIPVGNNIGSVEFKPVVITDYPRFSYRGMHLDVSRHMFSLDSIKIYIDMLALHNINRFHWHLTDDQGWRVEIKKYPELTQIGANREQTAIGKNSGTYDGQPYGGFYTQEEIKDIVKYAQDRFITIVPEVDLPGHMLAALATYPNLGCTGGPYKTAQTWGIFDEVLCAGNEEIYPFLQGVFDEIIELFPSEYIHVGGDECPKTSWEKCPKCQAKIKELGLRADKEHSAEEKLQSYVIERIEKHINSKGRKIIGWNEILEGGIAPNATIMSWQGTEGGIAAARQGHDAIMTPSKYLYFDYYQTDDVKDELLAIGGYVPVETVYNYEPIADILTPDEQKHIIGVQANVWTEYIKSFNHVQYMTLPRMGALSEIQWTMPDKKNYEEFLPRLVNLTKLYKKHGYNYATHLFDINAKVETDQKNKLVRLTLSTHDNAPIYYTLDGSVPTKESTLYQSPIEIKETTDVKAIALREDEVNRKILEKQFSINKATFKPLTIETKMWDKHTYGGAPILVDGQKGGGAFSNGSWVGFNKDFVAIVDLENVSNISSVSLGTFIDPGNWVFNIEELIVEVSLNKKDYSQVFAKKYDVIDNSVTTGTIEEKAEFPTTSARFVKITAKYLRSQPDWATAPGKAGCFFIDEIVVE